jgi:hypothetical protein
MPDATADTREELVARLRADDVAADGWEAEPALDALQCHPDLIQRLTELARPTRGTRRAFVAGSPVITYAEHAITAATGTNWLVIRSDLPAGALATDADTAGLPPAWQRLDPWAPDVAFAKSTTLLRAHITRAAELAESHAWR